MAMTAGGGGAAGIAAGATSSGNEGAGSFKLLKTGSRPRELTGAVDLITHYGLREHYETYTKKSFPASIAESKYLRDVVGDIEIRKGEAMELGQMLRPSSDVFPVEIRPFDLETLRRCFTFRESGPVSLPEADRGLPTIGKTRDEERRKHKKHKHKEKHKHKDRDKEKDKEKRKEKHKDKDGKGENGEEKKKHKKKKRRHDGDEEEGDGHKHKKKKHKSSPVPDTAAAVPSMTAVATPAAAAAVKAR